MLIEISFIKKKYITVPIHFLNLFMCRIYSSEVLEHIADENISDVDFF